MENAGSEDMPEDAERKGLGTPATRASIIEGMIKAGLIERSAKNLLPTDKGVNLIKVLPDAVKSPKMTADWEHALKNMERGHQGPAEYMYQLTETVRATIASCPPSSANDGMKSQFLAGNQYSQGVKGEIVGKCPRCMGDVEEKSKGFFCENKDCKFALFKDNKFFTIKKKKITKVVAKKLLGEGRIHMEGLYSEKTGKTYEATIILEDTGEGWPRFRMEFGDAKKA